MATECQTWVRQLPVDQIHAFIIAGLLIASAISVAAAFAGSWLPLFTYGRTLSYALRQRLDGAEAGWLHRLASVGICVRTAPLVHEIIRNVHVQRMTVPKRWFKAFYFFAAVATLLGLRELWPCLPADHHARLVAALPTVLFAAHAVRRMLECACVHVWSATARMPAHLWAIGMLYYVATVLIMLPLQESRGACEPQDVHSAEGGTCASRPVEDAHAWMLPVGVAAWLAGNVMQHTVHWELARLRDRRTYAAGGATSSSSIPSGYLFQWVHCPHYSAEILVYVGLALVRAACAPTQTYTLLCHVCIVIWCAANLGTTGMHTREWYASKFERRADEMRAKAVLLPGVF